MTYKLIWKHETIESDIKDMEAAKYLKHEYQIAYNDLKIRIEQE